eukprot:gene36065-biopygen28143
MLGALCGALGLTFKSAMLSWPAGPRSSDGVWAPAWYDAVERSTGFAPLDVRNAPTLPDALRRIADAARPHFEALKKWKLTAEGPKAA